LGPGARPKECVVLREWALELVPHRSGRSVPVIRGLRVDESGPDGAMWRTCEIIGALSPTLLVTRKSAHVELQGPLCRSLAREVRLAPRLMRHFSMGFPDAWEDLFAGVGAMRPTTSSKANTAATTAADEPRCPDEGEQPEQVAEAEAEEEGCSGPWTEAHLVRLREALALVRPSAPHFWRQVALFVGRPPDECQTQEYGSEERERRGRKRGRKALEEGDEEPAEERDVARVVLPRGDGPRRAQKLKAFITARSFGAHRDFLKVPCAPAKSCVPAAAAPLAAAAAPEGAASGADGFGEEAAAEDATAAALDEASEPLAEPTDDAASSAAAAAVTAAPAAAAAAWAVVPFEAVVEGAPGQAGALSPSGLEFLGSLALHTGLTPCAKHARPSAATAGAGGSGGGGSSDVVRRLDGAFDDAAAADGRSLLDLGDSTWQPKGIDRFIFDARTRRGKLNSRGPFAGRIPTPARAPISAVELAARHEFRKAPRLFRKVDVNSAAAAAAFDFVDGSPRSVAENSEDEAPIAWVPVLATRPDPLREERRS